MFYIYLRSITVRKARCPAQIRVVLMEGGWQVRIVAARKRGRLGQVLVRTSHQDRAVIAPGGVDPLGEGRRA